MKFIYLFAVLFVAKSALCNPIAVAKVDGVTGDEPKIEKVEFVSDDKKSAKGY